ncbi:MAG: DUF349 domain-containing protein [Flammeovirgaceae bacterium]
MMINENSQVQELEKTTALQAEKSNEATQIEETHEEHEDDYSHLSLDELLAEAQKLTKEEDVVKAERKIKRLRDEVARYNNEMKEAARQKFLAAGGDPDSFEYKNDERVEKFFVAFKEVKDKKTKYFDKMQKNREDNFKAKKAILEEIKNLIESADQKGVLDKVKALQQAWKQIGAVPQNEAENLYNSYHAVLDRFYDNKGIEYELKQLDRQKNLTAKKELCERAEKLIENNNINEAVSQLNALHEEYKSLGPVPKEEAEALWIRFKAASDKIYEKKRVASEELKRQLKENMVAKQQLCAQIEPFANFNSDKIKDWNTKTKEIQDLQKAWEKIGPLPKEVAKDINKQFWANFKTFFANKSAFFEKLDASRSENLKRKEEIIAQIEALQDSEDFAKATETILKLQEEWKKVGPVPESQREPLFEKFKKACDHFFERKRSKGTSKDAEFELNLKKKQEVIAKIDALTKETFNIDTLKQLKEEYFSIGFVPKKEMNPILEKFLVSIDKALDKSPLEGKDKQKQKLEFKAELMKNLPSLSKNIEKQEQAIRKKIAALENDIALWENNLMFFANSKTADKLRQDFNKKVEKANEELNDLKEQLKLIVKMNQ